MMGWFWDVFFVVFDGYMYIVCVDLHSMKLYAGLLYTPVSFLFSSAYTAGR